MLFQDAFISIFPLVHVKHFPVWLSSRNSLRTASLRVEAFAATLERQSLLPLLRTTGKGNQGLTECQQKPVLQLPKETWKAESRASKQRLSATLSSSGGSPCQEREIYLDRWLLITKAVLNLELWAKLARAWEQWNNVRLTPLRDDCSASKKVQLLPCKQHTCFSVCHPPWLWFS